MIFLCFSSGDHYSIVESILYHLKNYGFKVWYDYHILILGDNKYTQNITNGVEKCKYVIWVLSPNFYNCECGQMELSVIKRKYINGEIHIFPILYNVTANELPPQYQWVKDIIYNELKPSTPSLPTCNQIVCKILKDEISEKKYVDFSKLSVGDEYIQSLLNTYFRIDEQNFNSKIAILYCIYEYIKTKFPTYIINSYYSGILNQLFKQTELNLTITFKEIIIAESVITIMLNERIELHEDFDS